MRVAFFVFAVLLVDMKTTEGTALAPQPATTTDDGSNLPRYLPRKRCEVCVTVLLRKMSQVPHLCEGMEHYFDTVK